jgi:hypothetical protein
MTSQTLCADLIERYLSTRALEFLRGDHDGEYFCVVNARPGRLHVHLEMSSSFGDMLVVSVTPSRVLPVTDRPWVTTFADTWNRRNRGVTALVHGSSDSAHIGVSARRSQWIREDISFEDFTFFIDRTIAAAIDLFGQMTPVVEAPNGVQSLLREVS